MNAYKVFIGSIVFFALFTGASNFQQDFFDKQDVDHQTTTALDKEYSTLRSTVDSIRSNVREVQRPESGVLDSVTAGLFLVPDFLRLILAPITILLSTFDTIAASYIFIPQFAATGLKTIVIAGVSWSAFRLLIGLRG